jgi:hypothetical protein
VVIVEVQLAGAAANWNTNPEPFIWKATAEDIIAKVQGGREALHHIRSAMDH